MNIFSANSLLGRFMNWIANIVILNALWIIFSLPLVTIGASTTALYYSLMKWMRRDEGYIHTNFVSSFKANFKQSTIIYLLMLLFGGILFVDFRIGSYFSNIAGSSTAGNIMLVISTVLFIPYVLTLTYIFPVQAKFENTIWANLKNSLLMAIAHFGYTLLIYLYAATFILLTLVSKAFIGLEILCGISLFGYLASTIYITVFRKHLPEELEDDAKASGIDNTIEN